MARGRAGKENSSQGSSKGLEAGANLATSRTREQVAEAGARRRGANDLREGGRVGAHESLGFTVSARRSQRRFERESDMNQMFFLKVASML